MNIFGQSREVMHFDFGGPSDIPNDTIWGFGALLARGIGIIQEQYFDGAYYVLHGAIIDSIQYGTIVSIDELPETIPRTVTLYQNFPNPFNPATTISYRLPATSEVELVVYDILGRKVKTLVNRRQAAGSYTVRFDASDLPSGVYFCRLNAAGKQITRKILLLR